MEEYEDYGEKARDLFRKNKQQVDMKTALKELVEALPEHIKFMGIKATLNFSFYTELQRAGFTQQEALEIVKARGM
jgi:hypothetical protein